MNRIKFKVDEQKDYPIEAHVFETYSQHSSTYYRKNAVGEMCHFAVCPACNGPVQVIGLYKKLANTDRPYAKHVSHSISNLATYIQENYNYCPFRAKREVYSKATRKVNDGGLHQFIVQKLISKFDKIILFISKKTGIFISLTLAESMLDDYFSSRAYLYPGSTLLNLPLMLAYFMRSRTLFGRIIQGNEKLEQSLISTKLIGLKDKKVVNLSNKHKSLTFYFLKHDTILIEYNLTEYVWFEVVLDEHVIFKDKWKFEPDYAENIMNYQYVSNNEKINQRNATLLDIAKRVAEKYGFRPDLMGP